jgi:SAM-dependent methyltransferase
VGKRHVKSDQQKWDERYAKEERTPSKKANPFLRKNIRCLPKGKALDIAAGRGENAVFLAQHGFDVDAVDISRVGLLKARRLARNMGVKIQTLLGDLETYSIQEERYDVIANFYFLKRSLIPKIKKGLRKGGRVIFETYTLDHRTLGMRGPKHPRYFLKPNELLGFFRGFRVLVYREGIFKEEGRRKAIASLIAEKTS